MNITITGWGPSGMKRSIMRENYRERETLKDGSTTYHGYKKINDKNTQFQGLYSPYGGFFGINFYRVYHYERDNEQCGNFKNDGVALHFYADIEAKGTYDVSLKLDYEELEMLLLAKTKSKYTDLNLKLEEEKNDLEDKISGLEHEIEVLEEKVKKYDEIREKMFE